MKRRFFLLVLMVCSLAGHLTARDVAVKSNLLYDATLNANAGVEFALAPKWSFDLSGNLNLWKLSNGKQWRNWQLQPEARYWLCNRFAGHFFAAHLLGGQYNIAKVDLDFKMFGTDFSKLKDTRYQGWYAGAGVAYGYTWILNRHWSFEGEIGIGWTYTRYDRYPCAVCGTKLEHGHHNYFGPTKAALNIIYVF